MVVKVFCQILILRIPPPLPEALPFSTSLSFSFLSVSLAQTVLDSSLNPRLFNSISWEHSSQR